MGCYCCKCKEDKTVPNRRQILSERRVNLLNALAYHTRLSEKHQVQGKPQVEDDAKVFAMERELEEIDTELTQPETAIVLNSAPVPPPPNYQAVSRASLYPSPQ